MAAFNVKIYLSKKWFFPFIFALVLVIPITAMATGEDLDNRVRKISHKLRCPTCQAMSVKESDAGLSLNMKSKIREMLVAGSSEKEILEFFVERYGEWILREPPKKGFNLFLWLAPLVLILLVGFLVIRTLLKKRGLQESSSATPLTSEERKRIEKDLDRFQLD